MRAGIGLISVLIGGLIVAYLWSQHTGAVSQANKTIQPQLHQMAGKSSDGTPAKDSAAFTAIEQNGALKGLQVKSVVPGGALGAHYGLAANDVILRIGPFQMGDSTLSDFDAAKDMLIDGFQRNQDIVVDRGGTEITLPAQRGFSAPAATGGTTGGAGATPGSSPAKAAQDLVNKAQGE